MSLLPNKTPFHMQGLVRSLKWKFNTTRKDFMWLVCRHLSSEIGKYEPITKAGRVGSISSTPTDFWRLETFQTP